MANREAASFVRAVSPSTESLTRAMTDTARSTQSLRFSIAGLAAALVGSGFVAPRHRDDYPAGYRVTKRLKPADVKRQSKRKAQRRARRINRSQA